MEDSIVYRGKQPQLQKHVESLSGAYIYGGCLFAHFGHFIWESLSRLYAIKKCKDYPILFICPNDEAAVSLLRVFISSIGVRNKVHLVKVPTLVENLIYSSPGSSISPLGITDDQIDALQHFVFNEKSYNKNVWLSRSRLKAGRIANECFIEDELRKSGYEIIYPETLPLREQVRVVSSSNIVAGFDGSQFFSLLFSKEARSKFFVFNRRKRIPDTISYAFEKKNAEFSLYTFDLEYVDGDGAGRNFRLPAPDTLLDILKK